MKQRSVSLLRERIINSSARGLSLFLSCLIIGEGAAFPAKTPRPENLTRMYSFEFTPSKTDNTFRDYLDFSRGTVQGLEALRAQYLVAELYMFHDDYKTASKILQDVAAVVLDDEFFNISILEKLADCYMHLGLFEQASQAYSSVSKSDLKAIVPESILGLAVTALAMGDRDQAYLRFQELISFYPAYKNDIQAMLPLGLIQWENGKYADAQEYFMKDDKNPACLYFSGLCLRANKKPVEAMGMFKRLINEYPKTVWAERSKFETGETFYQSKDYPLAMKSFEQLMQDYPKSMWQNLALYRLACSDFQTKQWKPADQKFSGLHRSLPDNHDLRPNVTYLLTETFAQENKMQDVVKLLEVEAKGKTRTADTVFRLIWSYAAVGKYEDAINLTNEFLSGYWDKELTPKALLVQGYCYGKMNQYPEAVASYQLLVDRFPKTGFAPTALHLMALDYFRSQQYGAIVTQVNHQWNTLDPEIRNEHPEALYWIGEAHLKLQNGPEARAAYQKFIDLAKPDNPLIAQALLGQGVSYTLDKDYDTAIMTLQRSYANAQEKKDTPMMATLMLGMGDIFFNAKNYENAAASYRNFESIDPKNPAVPRAMYQEGLALHRAEYYTDAVTAWDKMAKAYPKDDKAPDAMFRAAKTQFDMGKYPDAVKSYQALVKEYPNNPLAKDARLQIAQCYYNAGDYNNAISSYSDFLDRFPNDEQAPNVLQLLQTCYFQAKKTPEEIEKLTKNQPKSAVLADIYWEEGAKLYNDKNYDKAREYFQKILYDFPVSSVAPQAAFYRAESLYLQEKYVEAVPAYQNFIDAYPTDAQLSQAKFHLAISLFNQNKFEDSGAAFAEFVKSFPDDPMAKNAALNVAVCYSKANDTDNALEAYQHYIKTYPDSDDIGATYIQMGALLEKAGKDEKAAEVYKSVPGNLKERAEALFNAGRCYRKLNKPDEEKEVYQALQNSADKSDQFRVSGLLQLAEIYLVKNDYNNARKVYQDVIDNAKDQQSVAAAQQGLQSIPQQGGN